MKRLFPFYAAFIIALQPVLWCGIVGVMNSILNEVLLFQVGPPRPLDAPIRQISFWIAAGSPLLIWPVAGTFFGVDMLRWRFSPAFSRNNS